MTMFQDDQTRMYLRRKAIADLYASGWSAEEIACAMKYTKKFVIDQINSLEREKQMQLPGDLNDTILGYNPKIVEVIKTLNIQSCKELKERLGEFDDFDGFGPKRIAEIERIVNWAIRDKSQSV